jgi:hypothetical protein
MIILWIMKYTGIEEAFINKSSVVNLYLAREIIYLGFIYKIIQ